MMRRRHLIPFETIKRRFASSFGHLKQPAVLDDTPYRLRIVPLHLHQNTSAIFLRFIISNGITTWLGIALLSGCASQQPKPEGAPAPALEPASPPQQASQGEAAPEDEQAAPKAPAEGRQDNGEPGEVAVEAPVMAQQEPSPFAQAMREAMVRQQPKLAQCHQSHETGSSQWADCLCQAMCEAPLKLDAPMTKSVKVSWPMISAAIGVYSLVYGPTGEVERCERSKREVSETFWCQETIESETPRP